MAFLVRSCISRLGITLVCGAKFVFFGVAGGCRRGFAPCGPLRVVGSVAVRSAAAAYHQLEAEVDKLAIRVLALRAPMADDLREVIAALKIGGVLERIGDYSKNIAKRTGMIEGRARFEPLTLLPTMGELAGEMVHDVLTAYAARDPDLAREVIATDAKVDGFYNSIFRNLVSYMVENPSTISSAAQLLFVARNIERIGDHATNVAEMVHFAATGTYPPEGDR